LSQLNPFYILTIYLRLTFILSSWLCSPNSVFHPDFPTKFVNTFTLPCVLHACTSHLPLFVGSIKISAIMTVPSLLKKGLEPAPETLCILNAPHTVGSAQHNCRVMINHRHVSFIKTRAVKLRS
jgi:hypothetical protein